MTVVVMKYPLEFKNFRLKTALSVLRFSTCQQIGKGLKALCEGTEVSLEHVHKFPRRAQVMVNILQWNLSEGTIGNCVKL